MSRKLWVKPFIILMVFSSMSIFFHELSHHLFGVESEVSLSRNYPLVPVTDMNKEKGIIGTLAGPFSNVILSYLGLLFFQFKNHKVKRFGLYLGIANSFLVISGAIINLIVDLMSNSMGNDLQQVSSLLNWNILILPFLYSIVAFIPFQIFCKEHKIIASNKRLFVFIIFIAWFLGGLLLITLDQLFLIRFKFI